MALDRLLAAVHDVPEAEPADAEVARTDRDWTSVYGQIATRFPAYGLYAVSSPLALGEAAMTGDAIDDLADLTEDLREVLWRGEQSGPDDAAWYLRFMYEAHWGRHARELALFLHARLSERLE
ncbi:protein of unknown function [Sphingomonas jatrophae]|uniref:DUF5063 domain-containing protein n=1 Tax=Sphingomonas jatrophae TaxID=1166337 RepID=A0A1I6LK42_9SPHN|nr:protein of unknown function [Sphingomonas jatrophae]